MNKERKWTGTKIDLKILNDLNLRYEKTYGQSPSFYSVFSKPDIDFITDVYNGKNYTSPYLLLSKPVPLLKKMVDIIESPFLSIVFILIGIVVSFFIFDKISTFGGYSNLGLSGFFLIPLSLLVAPIIARIIIPPTDMLKVNYIESEEFDNPFGFFSNFIVFVSGFIVTLLGFVISVGSLYFLITKLLPALSSFTF